MIEGGWGGGAVEQIDYELKVIVGTRRRGGDDRDGDEAEAVRADVDGVCAEAAEGERGGL